jgi:hypothetical protein
MGFLVLASAFPAGAQGLRTVIEPRDKVFPGVEAGVTSVKRDSSGRYYVLAKPATAISEYGPDGNLIDHIPNAKSNGATIRYAVDLDLNSDGLLVVADRGANAIDVFRPDGSLVSKIPVVAPTSVVALPDGQLAVTSLISKRLVEILDERGKVIRSFGDPNDIEDKTGEDKPEKQPLADLGKISGDSAGGIYFAFTSVPDPTLRKYDRYGYVGYESSLPESVFSPGGSRPSDRVELSFGFSDVDLSNQTTGWVTLGSSSDLKFGGGLGTGLSDAMRRGVGLAQAVQQTLPQPGAGGGPFGAMFSGEVTSQGTDFQMGVGKMSSFGGRGRGHTNFGTATDQSTSQGTLLQFNSSGSDDSAIDASDFTQGSSSISGTTAELGTFGSPNSGTSDTPSGSATTTGDPALGLGGLPAGFVFGNAFNSFGFRPQGFGGPPGTTAETGGPDRQHAAAAGGTTGAKGPADFSHFGYHGRYRSGMFAFTGSMKVNLGDLGRISASEKPVITAMAADPETQEIWAGIGDTLVHFSKDGSPLGIYYLALKGGTSLKPAALLVEPDRILIAADPWGIFEFARPDKPASTPKQQLNILPQVTTPQP